MFVACVYRCTVCRSVTCLRQHCCGHVEEGDGGEEAEGWGEHWRRSPTPGSNSIRHPSEKHPNDVGLDAATGKVAGRQNVTRHARKEELLKVFDRFRVGFEPRTARGLCWESIRSGMAALPERSRQPAIKVKSGRNLHCLDNEPRLNY
ncbi:hypothetical protein DPEC_G00349810 [Dallia pectoralis]|uniref:Uncharacterized protein n=1 Tax=Dallia pectoralis TaxID=75939 RepID=A0ACC2F1K3_DALPE|nr:hypothetical protein DPEC_G00349810 [Dallia pectoralis]